jgi:hydrogenase maturation protein HypF
MAALIAEACSRIRTATGLQRVVLSGGVFMNALLTTETCRRLDSLGFQAYRHRLAPPNDGGLSLGQLAIAASWTG